MLGWLSLARVWVSRRKRVCCCGDSAALGERIFRVTCRGRVRCESTDFPVTAGVHDPDPNGSRDAYVSCFRFQESSGIVEGEHLRPVPRIVAFPNPAGSNVRLTFQLPGEDHAILSIHDASGRVIRRLLSHSLDSGSHFTTWDRRNDAGIGVVDGIYYVTLRVARHEVCGKLVLVQ
jgi:hypothetical protein